MMIFEHLSIKSKKKCITSMVKLIILIKISFARYLPMSVTWLITYVNAIRTSLLRFQLFYSNSSFINEFFRKKSPRNRLLQWSPKICYRQVIDTGKKVCAMYVNGFSFIVSEVKEKRKDQFEKEVQMIMKAEQQKAEELARRARTKTNRSDLIDTYSFAPTFPAVRKWQNHLWTKLSFISKNEQSSSKEKLMETIDKQPVNVLMPKDQHALSISSPGKNRFPSKKIT